MSQVQLTFTISDNSTMNKGMQVGDMGYYVPVQVAGLDNNFVINDGQPLPIGPITEITSSAVSQSFVVKFQAFNNPDNLNQIPGLGNGSFIMFSKDNAVNVASILGYYGIARFRNNSTHKAELYSAACEISESSK
tara:strand:- start:693 stop:1097 length:405 start_codon:yes stop_codon:yes gene_type:complete